MKEDGEADAYDMRFVCVQRGFIVFSIRIVRRSFEVESDGGRT